MTNKETWRLLKFQYAKQHAFRPTITVTSRRSAKSKSNATGQILKNSKIVPGVRLETVFNTRITLIGL